MFLTLDDKGLLWEIVVLYIDFFYYFAWLKIKTWKLLCNDFCQADKLCLWKITLCTLYLLVLQVIKTKQITQKNAYTDTACLRYSSLFCVYRYVNGIWHNQMTFLGKSETLIRAWGGERWQKSFSITAWPSNSKWFWVANPPPNVKKAVYFIPLSTFFS